MKQFILILIIPLLFSCKKEDPVILVPEYSKIEVISSGNQLTPYINGERDYYNYYVYCDVYIEFRYTCLYDEPQVYQCKKYTFNNLKIGDKIELRNDKEFENQRWIHWQVYKDDILETDAHSEYCYSYPIGFNFSYTIRGVEK